MSVDRQVFLKRNVVLDPLFNHWYAWTHLISPATAALNVANHVKIMKSFLANPEVHEDAAKDPQMMGGPFLDCPVDQSDRVAALLERTLVTQAKPLELVEALKGLDALLAKEGQGLSLESLYARVPAPLRGYVELFYDQENRPTFRLFESLLYRSPFYNRGAQALELFESGADGRPFMLSTPRLEDPTRLHVSLTLDSPAIDALVRAKWTATSLGTLRDSLHLTAAQVPLLDALVTDTCESRVSEPYRGEQVRVRYFGHACVLMEAGGVSVITDPIISYDDAGGIDRYSFSDLPETLDYVLITHNHQDHAQIETLLHLRHRVKTVLVPRNDSGSLLDPSLKLTLEHLGFRNVVAVDDLQTLDIPGGSIMALPFLGEHGDLLIRAKTGYIVSMGGRSVLFAADSRNMEPELYAHVHRWVGDVDMMFVGMECEGAPGSWVYGPLMLRPLTRKMDQARRLNGSGFEQAASLVKQFNPRSVWVYAMAQEPWLRHVLGLAYTPESIQIIESDRLVKHCRERELPCERLYGRSEMVL
ncbi:MBL fold metallo-hydrolase [Corallococcus sp. CA047B]|uniref:MBL fold metallo-hydrolase n=1 Tax=Corallococcus sp. CA047B TaxID=2316729 RepID=UPI001F36FA40|nr:MBL fold metallo-hydrolase [Corallococcus sp. CA047B]